jgi:hypothetical protein
VGKVGKSIATIIILIFGGVGVIAGAALLHDYEYDGISVLTNDQLTELINEYSIGDKIEILENNGESVTIEYEFTSDRDIEILEGKASTRNLAFSIVAVIVGAFIVFTAIALLWLHKYEYIQEPNKEV